MGWFIRKSLAFGPLRVNLSKSGLGTSVGIRGFRVGTGPRGRYLNAGRGGLYYRKSLNSAGEGADPAAGGPPDSLSAPAAPAKPGKDGLARFIGRLMRGR